MDAKFTPGPWHQHEEWPRFVCSADESNGCYRICTCEGRDGEANARLIAAAPDLLAACKLMLAWINDPDAKFHAMVTARRAISSAIATAELGQADHPLISSSTQQNVADGKTPVVQPHQPNPAGASPAGD
jgi:hypothetical protein